MTIFMHTGTSQASVQNYKNATVIACLFWTALMVAARQIIYRLDSRVCMRVWLCQTS